MIDIEPISYNYSNKDKQIKILSETTLKGLKAKLFDQQLKENGIEALRPEKIEIFQVNIGYICNQTCKHCHVDAGPQRKEIMTKATMQQCLDVMEKYDFHTLDITGGAPEMNPDFRWFVREAKKRGIEEIIVRCNLTIILANPKYHDLPDFYKEHKIRIVSSLPFYNKMRTDRQRGNGVFDKSIRALQMLNDIGYGKENTGLVIDLVYNPVGAFLPGAQQLLEKEYKNALAKDCGITFNNLLTITNMPINRFLDYLIHSDNYEDYMEKLINAFNPATVDGLMCRNTISVDWQGFLYDCDFNQMLALKVAAPETNHISNFDIEKLSNRKIITCQHCYGCTAGAGSSCQGATA